ncbi:conserved membrane hypothetical protein [Candidatus Terasakiella magnetica]|uniref:Integral membrane protein n=1 Tax=Candidatus Terasakiella magnetica TaxID=1867952 RepID=A0A1C3RC76_9PROT|nr:DUF2189 domain-containing protein [Candidatus Terasakiella magnetica]SCA54865.1 conserved membrane hypothetical protein [Candidatus Terasakiella magnetica]
MSEATTPDTIEIIESNKVHLEAPAQWLKQGWTDFKQAPAVGLTYGAIFVFAGYGLFWGLEALGLSYFILPLSGSFMLFAPWLALGLYEVSRQREKGQTPTFASTCNAWRQSPRRLGIMAFVLLIFMLVWTQVAVVLYALMMGDASLSLENMGVDIFARTDGLVFLAVGSIVGLVFASIVFLLTAVSVPMILDRDTGAFEAMAFSFKTVMKNSHVMWSWAFTIGIISWFAIATFFIGLIIAMPVLGYASWHAYRDLVPAE